MSTWICGWAGCPDAGIERHATDPAAALDHHYRTHHQHQATPIVGTTHTQAWAAIDARAIASARRRSNPQTYTAARHEVEQQKQRRKT